MVNVLSTYPPNYAAILKALPAVKHRPGAVFTYAPHVYYPAGRQLPPHLIKHEETHIAQQGDDPAGWWEKYLADPKFRYQQELEAYRVQFRAAEYLNRGNRRVLLAQIAADLSSAMYGKIVTKAEALKEIQNAEV